MHSAAFCGRLCHSVVVGKQELLGTGMQMFMQSRVCLRRDPPVAVAGHLPHDLAVDLILQGVVLGGRAKDLVSQLYGIAGVMGVVAHVPQDRWRQKVKEFSGILNDMNVGKEAKRKKRLKIHRPKRCQVVDLTVRFMKNNRS